MSRPGGVRGSLYRLALDHGRVVALEVAVSLVTGALFTPLACSSTTPAAPPAMMVDAAAPVDAATEAVDAGCNELAQLATSIATVCDAGTPPMPSGGIIAEGTYVLVESRVFGTCTPSVLAETLLISGGTVQSLATGGDGQLVRKSLGYALTGTTMAQIETCPTDLMNQASFSATANTLTIFLSNLVSTHVSTFARM
jgi:hypothetical protein